MRLATQARNGALDVDIISDDELVLVSDELRQCKYLRAPTIYGCTGVPGGLENKRDMMWIVEMCTQH